MTVQDILIIIIVYLGATLILERVKHERERKELTEMLIRKKAPESFSVQSRREHTNPIIGQQQKQQRR